MSVLKQRVLTGAVMAGVFFLVLAFAPTPLFAVLIGAVMAVAAWEWANFSSLSSGPARGFYVAAVIALGLLFWWITAKELMGLSPQLLLMAAAIWWGLALLWVQGYPASALLWRSVWMRLLMGCWVLIPAWLAITWLRAMPQGQWLVLAVVLIVAVADSAAYFAGRRFGRRKLAPKVSPGKSWEGVAGGLLGVTLLTLLVFLLLPTQTSWWMLLGIALPTAFVSVLGDLLESMLKRHRGIKDSGQILPGHGGVMDRVDGLVAAAPVFALAVIVTGWQF